MATITIKYESRPFTPVEKYLMTKSPDITSIKDVEDGTSIPVNGYLLFEDEKDDGEISTIVSIITPEKKVFSAQSKTFRESLSDIHDILGDEKFSIIKTSGQTKAGRPYVNCYLDVNSISD